jgi:hypothetical protein
MFDCQNHDVIRFFGEEHRIGKLGRKRSTNAGQNLWKRRRTLRGAPYNVPDRQAEGEPCKARLAAIPAAPSSSSTRASGRTATLSVNRPRRLRGQPCSRAPHHPGQHDVRPGAPRAPAPVLQKRAAALDPRGSSPRFPLPIEAAREGAASGFLRCLSHGNFIRGTQLLLAFESRPDATASGKPVAYSSLVKAVA